MQRFKDVWAWGVEQIKLEIGPFSEVNAEKWTARLNALDVALTEKFPRAEDMDFSSVEELAEKVKFYGAKLTFFYEDVEGKGPVFTCYIMDKKSGQEDI